jgi:hypothetical protein
MLDFLLKTIINIIEWFVNLLPTATFSIDLPIIDTIKGYIGIFDFIIDMQVFFSLLTLVVTIEFIYLAYRLITRAYSFIPTTS